MRAIFRPSVASGVVVAPPSKSVTHRALICGALTAGCTICNVAFSQDDLATVRCLEAMGASVAYGEDFVRIGGLDPFHLPSDLVLDCGESGTTLRFLLPLCLLSDTTITLIGSDRLMQRPLGAYKELCDRNGLCFQRHKRSVVLRGPLCGDDFRICGDLSSQFVSGLLLALSVLPHRSHVSVDGNLESAPYVELTRSVISAFGVEVSRAGNTFTVEGKKRLQAETYSVEGDCSNAAYLDAFNLVNGDVRIDGISPDTEQGDYVYREWFARLRNGEDRFDVRHCPDLAPVLLALAPLYGGVCLTGTERLRIKESDRVAAMMEELSKFGIRSACTANDIQVYPGTLGAPCKPIDSHNDHRIVMALSLLCSKVGGVIENAQAIAKSYPKYFSTLKELGVNVGLEE